MLRLKCKIIYWIFIKKIQICKLKVNNYLEKVLINVRILRNFISHF